MKKNINIHNIIKKNNQIIIYTKPKNFHHTQKTLKKKNIKKFTITKLKIIPQNKITLKNNNLINFKKILNILKNLKNIQKIHHNINLPK